MYSQSLPLPKSPLSNAIDVVLTYIYTIFHLRSGCVFRIQESKQEVRTTATVKWKYCARKENLSCLSDLSYHLHSCSIPRKIYNYQHTFSLSLKLLLIYWQRKDVNRISICFHRNKGGKVPHFS